MGIVPIPIEEETKQQKQSTVEDSIAADAERDTNVYAEPPAPGADNEHWFLCFVQEITSMEGMPVDVSMRIWPIAARYAGMQHDIEEGQRLELEEQMLEKATELQEAVVKTMAIKAAGVKHRPLNLWKEKAISVAIDKWQNGCSLLHHRMANHLVTEYEEDGKHPFSHRPDDPDKDPCKVLVPALKKAAHSIKRPDLVYGLPSK